MNRQALGTVAVALLLVVAGCAGFASDGEGTPDETADPTATPTQSPPPTTTTPPSTTADPNSLSYPSGWSETGVEDNAAAMESHYRAVLSGPSATVTYRSEQLTAESGDTVNNTSLTMRLDTGERRLFASVDSREDHREAFLADGTMTRWSARNETVLGRSNASFVRAAQSMDDRVLRSQLLLYKLELNETVTRGGVRILVYDAAGVYANTLSRSFGTPKSASGRVVISGRGRVLSIDTTVQYTEGNVSYRYAQTRIGETDVPAPDWLRQG